MKEISGSNIKDINRVDSWDGPAAQNGAWVTGNQLRLKK